MGVMARPSARLLLLTILVGCGGATDLGDDTPSQEPDVIGNTDGGRTNTGSGNRPNAGGNTSAGNATSTGGVLATGGTLPAGGPGPVGGAVSMGGSFTGGGNTATAGGPTQGGTPGVGGSATFTRPPICELPFDPGPCRGAVSMFAYVTGSCAAVTYGGCEGNENRFATLEQCIAICEGRPYPNGCPEGRVQIQTCIACNPAGGCNTFLDICAATCKDSIECGVGSPGCDNGVCVGTQCQ